MHCGNKDNYKISLLDSQDFCILYCLDPSRDHPKMACIAWNTGFENQPRNTLYTYLPLRNNIIYLASNMKLKLGTTFRQLDIEFKCKKLGLNCLAGKQFNVFCI